MRVKSPDLLLALMSAANLSYGQTADFAKCHKSFISHLASGRRSSCTTELAERIAEVLKVDVKVLFDPRPSTSSTANDKQKAPAA